jgi:hypothetical protein
LGVSIRAYARSRGVSHVAVLEASKAGRIPLEAVVIRRASRQRYHDDGFAPNAAQRPRFAGG